MKRWRNLALGFVFSLLFLWLALRGLDWTAVGQTLAGARWGFALLAAGIWTVALGVRAARWRVLLGNQVGFSRVFHVLNIGFLINNTLPFRVGDLTRAYLIGRNEAGMSGWAALSTVVAERVSDMLAVIVMLLAVLPTLVIDRSAVNAGLLMGAAALIGFAILLALAHEPDRAHRLLRRVQARLPLLRRLPLEDWLARLLAGLRPLTSRRGLLLALLWTALAWLLSAAGSWTMALVFPALPQTAEMRAALTLSVVAASFSIIIPFTLASVGPFEAAAIFALLTADIPQEVAVAYAVVWHAAVIITYALWGIVGILALGLSLDQLRDAAGAARSSRQQVDAA